MKKLLSILCCTCCIACTAGPAKQNRSGAEAGTAMGDTLRMRELPLPEVPVTLRDPASRAAYIVNHFWDGLEFGDTLRSRNSGFMEQNFANFISLFPHADPESLAPAVRTLMGKARADSAAYMLLTDIAEKYLYDPNSPMLSEDYYILFLEQMVDSPLLGEYGSMRPRYQLEAARKNRPGMTAADFPYLTRNGRRATLHTTSAKEYLLLLFYDPECGHCKEIMAQLEQDSLLADRVRSGRLKVLAICAEEDLEAWKRTASSLPRQWTVGFDTGNIYEQGLYVVRAMPTLYLLDKDKRVVLKDVLPAQLSAWLQELR